MRRWILPFELRGHPEEIRGGSGRPTDLPTHGQIDAPENEVLLYEFKDGLNKYLARLPVGSPVRTLKELIDFNARNRSREMPFFDQELLMQSEARVR